MEEFKGTERASDLLRREIIDQSTAEARALIDKAEKEKAALLAEARSAAEKIHAEKIRKAQAEAEAIRRRILSGVHLEMKKRTLSAREEAVRRMLGMVREKMEAFRRSEAYDPFLKQWVAEGALALDSEDIIVTAGGVEKTRLEKDALSRIAENLNRNGKAVRLTLSKDTLPEGGVVLDTSDGRTRFDNSFSARLRRTQDAMRRAAVKALS